MKKAKKEYSEKKNNSEKDQIDYDDVTCFKYNKKGIRAIVQE